MYKRASQALQRRDAVDRPHPSRGLIDGPAGAPDVLPEASAMTEAQLVAERNQLRAEILQSEQGIAAAKLSGDPAAIRDAGQRKAALCLRLQEVKEALRRVDGEANPLAGAMDRLCSAINEIADPDTAGRIFARARELRTAAGRPKGGLQ